MQVKRITCKQKEKRKRKVFYNLNNHLINLTNVRDAHVADKRIIINYNCGSKDEEWIFFKTHAEAEVAFAEFIQRALLQSRG